MSAFQYKNWNQLNPGVSTGEYLQDLFTGSNNMNNNANTAMLNYQNQYNEYMTDKANAFTERMSNTEWQRGVKDMLAAGINPMVLTAANAGAAKNVGSQGQANYSGSAKDYSRGYGVMGSALANMVNKFLGNVNTNDSKALGAAASIAKFMG